MSEAGPSSTVVKIESTKDAPPPQRYGKQEIIHLIQTRKKQMHSMNRDLKLLKLAKFSACQESSCNCLGWAAVDKTVTTVTASDPCNNCQHFLSTHITHLSIQPEEELNRLLGMVVDAEFFLHRIHREQDVEVKRIYYNLLTLLKTSIVQLKKPVVELGLGTPPFENPCIAKGVMNFVLHKFNHLTEKDWLMMYTVAQSFLNSLNHYTLESPFAKKQLGTEELSPHAINYRRWMMFCFVPSCCDSLRHYDAAVIFGRTLLRSVFRSLKKELIDKCHLEKDGMQPEDRATILANLPRFLNLLEEEIYSPSAVIWEEDFKAIPSPHVQAALERRRQLALEKRTASPKLALPTLAQADSSSEQQNTFSNSRKNGRDSPESNKSAGEPLRGNEPKRRKIASAATNNTSEEVEDFPLDAVQQIVTNLEQEEKSTQRGISSLFDLTPRSIERAKAAEEEGQIKVVLLSNSLTSPVSKQTMIWLLSLRTLFRRQLTDMPVDYVTRLVFDPKHKNLALIKDNKPVGGICFRSFPSQGFSEVAFCAVHTSEQAKGYGAHMMNHLKEYHIRIKIYNLLAFADKNALNYFEKQGFSQNVSLDPAVYQGFIKYYDGACFMHCRIDPRIVYTELSSVLRHQKEVLKKLIDERKDNAETIHHGLTCFKEGFKRSIPIELIPGLSETGWKPATRATRVAGSLLQEEPSPPEDLQKSLKIVFDVIKNHKLAGPFKEPVDKEKVTDYYDIIKYPMDLKTMSERLEAGYYTTRRLFIADMLRIFNNCRTYNHPDTIVYKCACNLDRYFQTKMKEMSLEQMNKKPIVPCR